MNVDDIIIDDDPQDKNRKKINAKIPFPLPHLHFNMLLLASRKSGKTVLILNMLLKWYKKIFTHTQPESVHPARDQLTLASCWQTSGRRSGVLFGVSSRRRWETLVKRCAND